MDVCKDKPLTAGNLRDQVKIILEKVVRVVEFVGWKLSLLLWGLSRLLITEGAQVRSHTLENLVR